MVLASEVACLLNVELRCGDVALDKVCPLTEAEPGCLAFANACPPEVAATLNRVGGSFIIAGSDVLDGRLAVPHVVVGRPRLAFARAVAPFFAARHPSPTPPTSAIATNLPLRPEH